MKKTLFLVMTLICVSWGQAYADYSFSFVGTDSNGLKWDLEGVLQTTTISGQMYLTGGQLQEASGVGYAFSGTNFKVLGLNDPQNMHGVPNTGGADFVIDSKFNPTSNPVFTDNGINLVNSVGTTPYDQDTLGYAAPYVNIWGIGTNEYQMQYVGGQTSYSVVNVSALATAAPVAPVPIPGSALLLGSGVIGLLGFGRRKSKA